MLGRYSERISERTGFERRIHCEASRSHEISTYLVAPLDFHACVRASSPLRQRACAEESVQPAAAEDIDIQGDKHERSEASGARTFEVVISRRGPGPVRCVGLDTIAQRQPVQLVVSAVRPLWARASGSAPPPLALSLPPPLSPPRWRTSPPPRMGAIKAPSCTTPQLLESSLLELISGVVAGAREAERGPEAEACSAPMFGPTSERGAPHTAEPPRDKARCHRGVERGQPGGGCDAGGRDRGRASLVGGGAAPFHRHPPRVSAPQVLRRGSCAWGVRDWHEVRWPRASSRLNGKLRILILGLLPDRGHGRADFVCHGRRERPDYGAMPTLRKEYAGEVRPARRPMCEHPRERPLRSGTVAMRQCRTAMIEMWRSVALLGKCNRSLTPGSCARRSLVGRISAPSKLAATVRRRRALPSARRSGPCHAWGPQLQFPVIAMRPLPPQKGSLNWFRWLSRVGGGVSLYSVARTRVPRARPLTSGMRMAPDRPPDRHAISREPYASFDHWPPDRPRLAGTARADSVRPGPKAEAVNGESSDIDRMYHEMGRARVLRIQLRRL